jgi:HD-GYP domain-containing protein (c-di-GMP phosphodiesterase class II)
LEDALRLAEVLGAVSLTTDLGSGVPFEKGLRTCAVAAQLADALELDRRDQQAAYYAALLRSLGCAANASVFAEMFENEIALQRELKTLDLANPDALAAQTARFSTWAGEARARELTERFTRVVPEQGEALSRGSCEVSATLGARLGLSEAAIALDEVYERYDGNGFPAGRPGAQLTVAARVVHVAEQAVLAHYDGGLDGAAQHVARLAGGHLDPDMCAAFAADTEAILGPLQTPDMLAAALAGEPAPVLTVGPGEMDRVCSAFATFADLKGKYLLGHSARVAALAGRAAELLGYDAQAQRSLHESALLLDIGRVAVSSSVWDRAAAFGPVEWERVRLHSYWTERILRRCPALERIAPTASSHHERLDGSGYHRSARGSELSSGGRLPAAADMFAAMTEARPHRPAHSVGAAAQALHDDVRGAARRGRRRRGGRGGRTRPPPDRPAQRPHRPRGRGTAGARARRQQPRDRRCARALPAHGSTPPGERLRQDQPAHPSGGRGVRDRERARPGGPWSPPATSRTVRRHRPPRARTVSARALPPTRSPSTATGALRTSSRSASASPFAGTAPARTSES